MKKILVVVDCQNDFISGALGSDAAKAIVPNVVKKIKEYDAYPEHYIYFTRDTHHDDYLKTDEGMWLPIPHCLENTHGWEINPDILEAAEGTLHEFIDKPRFGSFNLSSQILLRTNPLCGDGKANVEICGLCTDICVVSNALMIKSSMRNGVSVTVDSQCCAGLTKEKHEAALEVMRSCQINVI